MQNKISNANTANSNISSGQPSGCSHNPAGNRAGVSIDDMEAAGPVKEAEQVYKMILNSIARPWTTIFDALEKEIGLLRDKAMRMDALTNAMSIENSKMNNSIPTTKDRPL